MDLQVEQLIRHGRAAFERRDYAAALLDFREVLARNPNFADIRHLAGLCLSFMGQPEAALEEFDRAVAINEAYAEAHLNRSITLNELGRYEEAQQAFGLANRFEHDSGSRFPAAVSARLANAHASLGDLYTEAHALADAADQYRVALTLRPRFVDIRTKLGQVLMELGEVDAAESEFRAALEHHPRFLTARLNLGLLLFRRGELTLATREWEICRDLQPANPQVRAYLSLVESKGRALGAHDVEA